MSSSSPDLMGGATDTAPTNAAEIEDPRWSIPLAERMDQRAAATPDLLAAIDENDRTLTFADLARASQQVADELRERGVEPGSRVAWQLPTWLETLILTSALSRLDTVQVPIPHVYRSHEVIAGLEQSEADLLITPSVWRRFDFGAMAAEVAEHTGTATVTLDRGAFDQSAPWFANQTLAPAAARAKRRLPLPEAVKWLFFTSGTSGSPKAVRHTERTVSIPAITMSDAFELSPDDRSAIAFPLGHIGGVSWQIGSLESGCTLLLAESLDQATIDSFAAHEVTLAGVSTAFHLAYRDRARKMPDEKLFPLVRAYPGGAATKPASLHHELKNEIGGIGIVAGYGLTECPMITMATVHDPDDKLANTEGRPSPGVVFQTRDPVTGSVLPAHTEGEIWVRAPQLFNGYVREADTATAIDANGFFRTGDIGRMDDEGFIVITGRLKDVIIRNGENISATEVEDHIFTHPDIADVAVIGLPDERVGERCCAVLVPRAGRSVPDVPTLGAFLRTRGLMQQKWPEQIEEVEALPRNPSGKVLKHQLVSTLSPPAPDES